MGATKRGERAKKGVNKRTAPRGAPAAPKPEEGAPEVLYTLTKAHAVLGKPDGKLEAALRSINSDQALRAEGVKVASERIVNEGASLSSKALAHLESKEAEVLDAARRCGLTRAWLSLTVWALVQLQGQVDHAVLLQKGAEGRQARARVGLGDSVTLARKLRKQCVRRLEGVVAADPELNERFTKVRRAPEVPDKLAKQATEVAGLIDSVLAHKSETVRVLAEAQGLTKDDARELREVAELIDSALEAKGKSGGVVLEELQAKLDVLDGFCLLLLGRVLKALRAMADLTPKVKRPMLRHLASYFDGTATEEDGADEKPAPVS